MKTAGIVAEFNPFHNGHRLLAERAREAGATHIAAVMGGDFLQRGEPALLPKHARAAAALSGGVDLVLELPLPYGCTAAGQFAYGGVALLQALGCVDLLAFGSECGDLAALQRAAEAVASPELPDAIRPFLSQGLSYAAARERAVLGIAGQDTAGLLRGPNNLLAVEYLVQLRRLGSAMQPFTAARRGDAHDASGASGGPASGRRVRELLRAGDAAAAAELMPQGSFSETWRALERGEGADPELLELPMLAKLRTMTPQDFAALPDAGEGLSNRLYEAGRQGRSVSEVLELAKSKRYARSRLQRILTCAFLGIPDGLGRLPPPYLRVLGFNARGAQILAEAKGRAALPVSSSLARLRDLGGDAATFAGIEARAADLYNLGLTGDILPCGEEYRAQAVRR